MPTDCDTLLSLWSASWDGDIWIAPWAKAVADLALEQAAWRPAKERHCIWQIVNHLCIWREYTLTKIDGRPGPSREETERDTFAMPSSMNDASWKATTARLRATHLALRDAIANPDSSLERLNYHLAHDSCHLGQVMYLRSMQGLAPIE